MPTVTFNERWRGNMKGRVVEMTDQQVANLRAYPESEGIDITVTDEAPPQEEQEDPTPEPEAEPEQAPEAPEPEEAPKPEPEEAPAPVAKRKRGRPRKTEAAPTE